MQLPYFYEPHIDENTKQYTLSAATHKHCTQVLRKKSGDDIQLLNGKGLIATATLVACDKKQAIVTVNEHQTINPSPNKKTIAISLLKNAARFEWYIEKAVEVGINSIVPLVCARTEKTSFKQERMQQIVVAAMLQSRNAYLPVLCAPVAYNEYIAQESAALKFIAHCANDKKDPLFQHCPVKHDAALLVGPEGDFSADEIQLALAKNWIPVSLGHTRLRTETAGIYGSILLCI